MTDAYNRLRGMRPTETSDARPNEAALELLLRDRQTPSSRRLRTLVPASRARHHRRALIAVPLAAAAMLVAIPIVMDGGERSGGLAAQAYAATTAKDAIVHEVVTRRWADRNLAETQETWWQESDGAARSVTSSAAGTTTVRVDARGVVRLAAPNLGADDELDDDGSAVIARPGEEGSETVARSARGVTAWFRSEYQQGRLQGIGTTTFEGRTVRAYTAGPVTFFVDPETAALVGSQHAAGPGPNEETVTMVVDTYDKLPAIPEHVAMTG